MKNNNPSIVLIRLAYIDYVGRRNINAEKFVSFSEKELSSFIRKYEDPNFTEIYERTDHNFYDRLRNKIAIISEMAEEDTASGLSFSIHLRTYSQFLQSKSFKDLFKQKINIEGKSISKGPDATTTGTGGNKVCTPKAANFRQETEGERKHITKEMDVVYRNPQLRQQCLDKYGYQCQCCGMNFAELYGEELGANFIEVHHLKLISSFETEGIPENFLENLVPLCSNCHSMIHHIKDSEHTLRVLREAYRGEKKELRIIKED